MLIVSWNVNGLRSVLRRDFIGWLGRTQADVVCLQETRVDPEELPPEALGPLGYSSCWATGERRGYSGVAAYCRRPVAAWQAGFGIPRFDVEGRVLVLDLGEIELYNVYFPNGKRSLERLAYKLDFYAAFLEHIDARVQAGRQVMFCGDVNTAHRPIDLARPKQNERVSGFLPEERAWLDRWTEHGWVDALRYLHPDARDAYTWWDPRTGARARNVGWRIDYFFVHQSLLSRVKAAGISADVMGSDHCPVWLELDG